MSSGLAISVVLQIAVPFALLGWQAAGRDTNIVAWGFKHVAAWTYIYATGIAGLWLLVPWYVPHLLMVISISLAARTLPARSDCGIGPRIVGSGLCWRLGPVRQR